jgi:hypothetical protein
MNQKSKHGIVAKPVYQEDDENHQHQDLEMLKKKN